ncbi:MAG: hypothetical protein ABW088_00190 [Sedimenticola sp.]
MTANITPAVDAVLESRGLQWGALGQSQKEAVVTAISHLQNTLAVAGLSNRCKEKHRTLSYLLDGQTGLAIVYDPGTGEWIPPKHDTLSLAEVIHEDPEAAHDKEELIERVEQGRLFRASDTIQRSSVELEFLRDRSLKLSEWTLLDWLISNLTIKNYCMTTLSAIRTAIDLNSSNLSNRLKALLKKNCIRELNRDMHKRGDRLFAINPVYGFRGNLSLREMLIKEWYPNPVVDFEACTNSPPFEGWDKSFIFS